jgi:hypothetical protein
LVFLLGRSPRLHTGLLYPRRQLSFVPAQVGSPHTIVGAGGTTSPTPMGTNASPQMGAQLGAPVFSPQVGPAQPTLGDLAVPPARLPSPFFEPMRDYAGFGYASLIRLCIL